MKPLLTILTLLLPVLVLAQPVPYKDFFIDSTLRVDYYHTGDKSDDIIALDHLYRQGIWAGNPRHLIDSLGYGRYAVRVYDKESEQLIYSKGYDSYFGEYRTTAPAKDGIKRTFHESVLIPYPRKPVRLEIEARDRRNDFDKIFSCDIDPTDYHINTETPDRGDEVVEALKSGNPHDKVDIVILGEGYTKQEREKFRKDLKKYTDMFFSLEPYKSMKNRFNIRGIYAPSPQSGVDEPRQRKYRHTVLGASFNSLDSDRYLLVEDNKTVRDMAAQVPYDIMMIMVNSNRYGGGGFYGYYSAFTSDGGWNDYVFHHEFGHAFGGLGDEYYTSDVAYQDPYPEGVEPTEPNLTRSTDPDNLKWKDLVTPGVSIPTDWGQETYDSLAAAREALPKDHEATIEELKTDSVSADSIARVESAYKATMRDLTDRIQKFIPNSPMRGKVGAYQGGGYLAKGIYRPTVNSIMNQFNQQDRKFYPVNERAIKKVIDYYSGE